MIKIENNMLAATALCTLLALAAPARADQAGMAIMKASEQATKSVTETSRYKMQLLERDGKQIQARELLFRYKRLPAREATLVRFQSPAAMAGTGLLIEDTGANSNDVWLYLPATRRLRRIAGAEKTNWFMGTEFTHEDFEDYQLHLYDFTRLREEACGEGRTCDVVSAQPRAASEREASGYSKKVYAIDKATQYPVRIEYFSRDGQLSKTLTASGLRRYGDYWRPQVFEMHNLRNGRRTRMQALERHLDGTLDDYLVSSRYLRAD